MNIEDKNIEINGDVTTITATEIVEQPASETLNVVDMRIADLENENRVAQAQTISRNEALTKLYALRETLAPVETPVA